MCDIEKLFDFDVDWCDGKAWIEKTEFTAEQQALAKDFMSMAEEYDAIADKVYASPELLKMKSLSLL